MGVVCLHARQAISTVQGGWTLPPSGWLMKGAATPYLDQQSPQMLLPVYATIWGLAQPVLTLAESRHSSSREWACCPSMSYGSLPCRPVNIADQGIECCSKHVNQTGFHRNTSMQRDGRMGGNRGREEYEQGQWVKTKKEVLGP